MLTVLVTDPEQRASLAAARALAAHGWRVVTIGKGKGLAGVSRSAHKAVVVPEDAWRDASALIAAVGKAVALYKIDVVLPVTDLASRTLLGKDDIVGARVTGPSAAAYCRASDKPLLLETAAACGIRVPRQHVLQNADDKVAERLASLPAQSWVVKPARSVVEVNGRAQSFQVQFANRTRQVRELVSRYPEQAYPLLLQERIVGSGVGVFLLRKDGRTLLQFGHRRLREKPPAGGVSTYREAMTPAPLLVERCERLLDQLEYEGPAMVEFKEDRTTHEPVLMEINARLWGSVQLAIDAGVNFPVTLVAMAAGRPIPEPVPIRPNTRTYWELGELDHALAIWRKSTDQLSVSEDFPVGIGAAVRSLLDRRWSDHPEVFRLSDPFPFLSETVSWLLRK